MVVPRRGRVRPNSLNPKPPEVCPVCGTEVPPKARACPECGADHNSGWREEATATDGLDLPEEDFDYDAYVREEFESRVKPRGMTTGWWLVAILVALAFVALLCF